MENLIIILFLIVIILIGLKSSMKHFKGQGGCCGGSDEIVQAQPKVLKHVLVQKSVMIEGMHCNHCKKWVEESINAIEGASAVVNLEKKEAVVSMEKEISDQIICNAVVKAGYKVVGIKEIKKG